MDNFASEDSERGLKCLAELEGLGLFEQRRDVNDVVAGGLFLQFGSDCETI